MDSSILIPGYKINNVLGQGGMATVYLAIQENLDRKVALKVMSASLASNPEFCERFLKEGKTIAKFSSHPDIVTIYDIGCTGPHYYMAMEYIGGANLKQRIQQQIDLDEPLKIIRQITGALGYAHSLNIIHRDVKPANILFREDGAAILTDFGIAKSLSSNTQLTRVGFTVGTPEYMSPEQAIGQGMDGRSDLYSLGVVLYEMLSGEKPFAGEDAFSTAMMHINNPVPKLPEWRAPYQLLIDRLLAKKPEERFANAEQLIEFIDNMAEFKGRTRKGSASTIAVAADATRTMDVATINGGDVASAGEVERSLFKRKWIVGTGLASAVVLATATFYVSTNITNDESNPTNENEKTMGGVEDTDADVNPGSSQIDPAVNARIANLLEIADLHFAVGRLKEPPGSNAFEAYQMVLELQPGNPQALDGLRRIEQETDAHDS